MLLRLDHFKLVNDRYGHSVGDQVLKQFADLAGTVVRSMDYVARLGGEEFLLVLVGADERIAMQVAKRLGNGTRVMRIAGSERDFNITVSIGIAKYRLQESISELLDRADQALYEAKRTGRDRAVVADV